GEDDGEEEDVPAPCPNARRLQPSLVRRVMADARPSKDGFPMRTHTLATLLALVGTLGLGACDKKDDEADAKKTDAKAADAKAADAKAAEPKAEVKADEPKADDAAPADGGGEAAGLGVMELSTLGLVAEAPADT